MRRNLAWILVSAILAGMFFSAACVVTTRHGKHARPVERSHKHEKHKKPKKHKKHKDRGKHKGWD